jgi:hypothetical protein
MSSAEQKEDNSWHLANRDKQVITPDLALCLGQKFFMNGYQLWEH